MRVMFVQNCLHELKSRILTFCGEKLLKTVFHLCELQAVVKRVLSHFPLEIWIGGVHYSVQMFAVGMIITSTALFWGIEG